MSSGKWQPFCLGLNVLKGRNRHEVNSYIQRHTYKHHEIQLINSWVIISFLLGFFIVFFFCFFFCFQNVILISCVVCSKCNIVVWTLGSTIILNQRYEHDEYWCPMAWCFSTRTPEATMLIKHPCISSCLWINWHLPNCLVWEYNKVHFQVLNVTFRWFHLITEPWWSPRVPATKEKWAHRSNVIELQITTIKYDGSIWATIFCMSV